MPWILGLLLMTGCPSTSQEESGQDVETSICFVYTPLAFQDGGVTATLSGVPLGTWQFDVMLEGWASAVTMDTHVTEGGDWDEQFTFENVANDPLGVWDEWAKELTDSNTPSDYVDDGDITLNDPTDAQFARMTCMFTAMPYVDRDVSACVVSGPDTAYYLDQGYSCPTFEW